jgi:ribosome-associated toxin RatA of RatAB toxin-antitoxin module
MKILGRDIDVRILGAADVQANQAKNSKDHRAEAFLYYAEEDPFKTVSTTELEERLKDLDEQQKVLVALQQLGGAEFDLTAERPMTGVDVGQFTSATSESGSASAAAVVDEEEVHEFQRLAHTLKLGRSLSINCEVNADIHVPYTMIADLKTYPDWMPWCTSGMVVGDKHEDATNSRLHTYKGEVAFGIETGSFLGTLGDNVKYQLKTVSPSVQETLDNIADGATPSSQHSAVSKASPEQAIGASSTSSTSSPSDAFPAGYARVVADASDGFAYGEKLIYDWRFRRLGPGLTKVELDMLFQARSVLYMPFWDSMQNMVMSKMLVAFKERAEFLQLQQPTSPR